jgi:hypothetical protein
LTFEEQLFSSQFQHPLEHLGRNVCGEPVANDGEGGVIDLATAVPAQCRGTLGETTSRCTARRSRVGNRSPRSHPPATCGNTCRAGSPYGLFSSHGARTGLRSIHRSPLPPTGH